MSYIPKFPYNDDQAIINSNRVTLNSKTDSIFLFSSKMIILSSNEGIHFNTNKEFIVNSTKIQLGLNADEPIPKGNKLKNVLEKILDSLEIVGDQLNVAKDSNDNPIPAVQTAGNSLIRSTKRIKTLLKTINSTKNFTV
jgi:hypothetical protein